MSEPLTRQQYVEYCKNCKNKSFDSKNGLTCGLTSGIPDFKGNCSNYLPIENDFENVQQQVIQLKEKRKKRKFIRLTTLVGVAIVFAFFSAYSVHVVFKNMRLSDGYKRTGDLFFEDKDYKGAIFYYDLAIESNDKNLDAIFLLGECYHELKQYRKAISYYTKAILLNKNFAEAYCSRGFTKYKMGNLEEAINDFKVVVELEPNNSIALGDIGNIYIKLCDFENAQKYYNKALEYNPEHYGIISSLANVEFSLGNYHKSIELCYKAIGHLEYDKGSPHGTLGLAYLVFSEYDSSLFHLNKALEYDPGNDHYYNSKGYTLSALGYDKQAINHYNQAIAIDSTNPDYFLNRGDSKSILSQFQDAIEDYDSAILLSKRYKEYNCDICYHNRSFAKKMLGDSIGYKQDLAKADSLGFSESRKQWLNLREKDDL